jgi:hypothetical protein
VQPAIRVEAALDRPQGSRVPHTARCTPWIIAVVVEFSDDHRAVAFEKYLTSGSGCAIALQEN